MNCRGIYIIFLVLVMSQNIHAENKITIDNLVGEWVLIASQLGENGPKYEDDGTSIMIFTSAGMVIEKSGLGNIEREYFIKNGKLFVKAPLGDAEWIIKTISKNKLTIKSSTGIVYLEKKY